MNLMHSRYMAAGLVLACSVLLAGCNGDDDSVTTPTVNPTGSALTATLSPTLTVTVPPTTTSTTTRTATATVSPTATTATPSVSPTSTRTATASPTSSTTGTPTRTATSGSGALPGSGSPTPPAATSTPVAAGTIQQTYAITIDENGIQPREIALPQGRPVHLGINNRASLCRFEFGDYIQGLVIDNNAAVGVNFTPVVPQDARGTNPQPIRMGCAGDANRVGQGTIVQVDPNAQLPGNPQLSPPDTGARQVDVTIRGDGITPADLTLTRSGGPTRLQIRNEGGPCRFRLGQYLDGLLLGSNTEGVLVFTPHVASTIGTDTGARSYGCAGDPGRQGSLTITP